MALTTILLPQPHNYILTFHQYFQPLFNWPTFLELLWVDSHQRKTNFTGRLMLNLAGRPTLNQPNETFKNVYTNNNNSSSKLAILLLALENC